jgi:hypothetical protein
MHRECAWLFFVCHVAAALADAQGAESDLFIIYANIGLKLRNLQRLSNVRLLTSSTKMFSVPPDAQPSTQKSEQPQVP